MLGKSWTPLGCEESPASACASAEQTLTAFESLIYI